MSDQEFFERKVRTLFSRFDIDSSGTIEESDFDKWTENLIALGNLSGDQANSLRENIKSLWRIYFAPADANGDGNISVNELISHIKIILGDESKGSALRDTIPLIFDSIDCNKDGSISKEEFANYFKSLNINDTKVAEEVYSAMDTNSDGSLNRDEFSEFGRNFFLSNDQSSASKLFFGPLAD